jgi:iron complex outermembrane receptor protein
MVAISNTRRAGLIGGAALTALIVGAGLATPASAQTAPAPAAQAEKLPEVVVTAERRVQNLQQTPISATVLGSSQLVAQGVNRVADLQTVAPGLAINTYNRSTFINIRGVGIAVSAPTSTPGVAYYIDGAFIPHEFNIGNTFYDLASVEVLRGPQGTLTGQNSTGGAIYTRTPDPRFDRISGYVDQTIGDYNWYRTVGAVNIPITPALALRAAAVHETRDSFYKNVGGANQPGNVNFNGGRFNLEYKPDDKLQLNARYENDQNSNRGNAYKNRFALLPTLPSGAANPFYNPNPRQINEDANGYYRQGGYRSDLEGKYLIIPSLQLRYMVGYQYGNVTDLVDGDRSTQPTTYVVPGWPANLKGRLGYTSTTNNILLNEFDLISQGGGPLEYVVGVFTMDEHVPIKLDNDGTGTVNLNTNTPTQLGGTGPNPTIATSINTSRSVFGQVTYRFNTQWQLIAGARYSSDKQQYTRVGIPGYPLNGPAYSSTATSTQPTGRVALNYNMTDATLIYGSVSRGYKSGGVNLTQANPAINLPANFLPETNTVEEIGVKTDILERHLRINADVFTAQYANQQLGTLTATTPANPYTTNVPQSRSYGGELEVTGRFDAWQFNGGLSYLKSQTASTVSLADASVNPALLRTVASGTTLPFSPEVSANLGVEYHLMFGQVLVTPRLQVNYVSKEWATIFETQGATGLSPGSANTATLVPEHTTTDLRITVEPRPNLQIEGFVTNLFDKTYIAAQVQDSSSANGGIIYGAPRQVGARLIYKFQ